MIAETIKQIRASAGLSQQAFAKSIGVCASAVGHYESGHHRPSLATWAKIVEKYHDHLEKLGIPEDLPIEEKKELPQGAEALKQVRLTTGLTQRAFAESIGVCKSTIGNCEAGMHNLSDELWARITEKYPDLCDKKVQIIIQSNDGREIDLDVIKAKVEVAAGDVDSIYVRIDHNAAYWVKGEETGKVELW